MNKALCFSQRKITKNSPKKPNQDTSASKRHLVSTSRKPHDIYSNVYRLPLKQIIEARIEERRDDRSYSHRKLSKGKNKAKHQHTNTDFKTKNQSSRKTSLHNPLQSTLKTDRYSNSFLVSRAPLEIKRIKTELHDISSDIETVQHKNSNNKRYYQTRQNGERSKEYTRVRLDDMMSLLATYYKLKSRNIELTNELDFYYEELGCYRSAQLNSSALKALNM